MRPPVSDDEAELTKPPVRVERLRTARLLETVVAPVIERVLPILEEALLIKPERRVVRPKACKVPEVERFPLPPVVASTQRRPVLKVLVFIPTWKVPLVITVVEAALV